MVDEHNDPKRFYEWKRSVERMLDGNSEEIVLNEISKTISEYHIAREWILDLLRGVEMDLTNQRFPDFQKLQDYCYKVASTVGLMVVSILGYQDHRVKEYAIHVGLALQLTNILRDIEADRQLGRNYIPESIWDGRKESFSVAVNILAQKAREYHEKADILFENISYRKALFPARAMQNLYRELLFQMERTPKIIRLSPYRKSSVIFKSWFQAI